MILTKWEVFIKRLAFNIFLAVILAVVPKPTNAQERWVRIYGGADYDCGRSVLQTSDGGYITTGLTNSFGLTDGWGDLWLLKTDEQGDTIWTHTYGGTHGDLGYWVEEVDNGGYIITGVTDELGDSWRDLWLLRTDEQGDTIWTHTYGGGASDGGTHIQPTSDGGYIIIGDTESFGAGFLDVWLLKTDAQGDTTWTRTYGGEDDEFGHCVHQTGDGGYILLGERRNRPSDLDSLDYDIWLLKTDAQGDTIWTRIYGGGSRDVGNYLQPTNDGGYIIVGGSASFGDGLWFLKTDENGDTLWTRIYDGYGNMVQQTEDGCYIIVGNNGWGEVWLLKTDAQGDTIWTRTFKGRWSDNGSCVRQTDDGGYIITGKTRSFGAGMADLWLIKTDSLGYTAFLDFGLDATKRVEPDSFVDYELRLSYMGNEDDSFHIYLGDSLDPGWRLDLWDSEYIDTVPWYVKLKAPSEYKVLMARVHAPEDAQIGDTNLIVLYTKTSDSSPQMEDSVFLTVIPSVGVRETRIEPSAMLEVAGISSVGLANYTLPSGESAVLSVYDPTGRCVYTKEVRGEGSVQWSDKTTSAGVYFVRLKSHQGDFVRKVVLTR